MNFQPAGVSTKTFRAMMLACVVLILAAGVSAAVYDDDDITLDQADADSTTTTTSLGLQPGESDAADPAATVPGVPDTATDPAAAGDPAATTVPPAATDDPATTTAPPATTAQAPQTAPPPPKPTASGAPSPITPGTYQYDTDGTFTIGTSERKLPPVTSMTAQAPTGDSRQVQVRDMRDANGDGTLTTTTFRFASEGVYLEKLVIDVKISGIGQTTTLTATKPFLIVPAKATAGTRTNGVLQGDGITAAVTFTVASVGADTSVADIVTDLSGEVEGRQTSKITARNADQLIVNEVVNSDVRSGGIQVKSNYTAKLR